MENDVNHSNKYINLTKYKEIKTNSNKFEPMLPNVKNLTNVNKKWCKATHTAAECGTAQLS